MDLDFTISVIILVPYVCQSTFMTCPADLSKNAMSIWTGGSPKSNWEWKHMFYHCLVSAHCIKNQHRQTQTKKTKLGLWPLMTCIFRCPHKHGCQHPCDPEECAKKRSVKQRTQMVGDGIEIAIQHVIATELWPKAGISTLHPEVPHLRRKHHHKLRDCM